ncbi:hypothetical protein HAX54_020304, partial [Datura stramonium]|nr:hypothetical protein [Datura stramonium]
PGTWVMEEVTSLQKSDDRHLGHHLFDGGFDNRQSSNGLLLALSSSGSLFGE